VVDVISALLLITVSLLFIWLSLGYVEQSRSISEASPDPGGIPLRWLVKSLIPLGYGLLVLQQLAHLVRLLDAPATQESAHV
jgi:TRAP-type mannitol/chloroaromatic compound transport system permease small subunit